MFRTTRENDRKGKITNNQNPSFSSSLLDRIYRSIDSGVESQRNLQDSRFFGSYPVIEQSKTRTNVEDFENSIYLSSGSCSTDASSSGFSSSDTETMYRNRTAKPFCVAPPRPRYVRIADKTEKKEQKRDHVKQEENDLIKSKSRAMKIYDNLKKVKQPTSPGGRFASFIYSLFTTTNNVKKSEDCRNSADGFVGKSQTPIKYSSSFLHNSRSCLSKHSTSKTEKDRNTYKRSVKFCPVSVIVGEDSKPCGHKSIDEEKGLTKASYTINERRIKESADGKAAARDEEIRAALADKSKRVEGMARDIFREYERKKKRKESYGRCQKDDDDDVFSCSSSELFDLDFVGNGRYRDELPVYETTHLQTNQAIASGLIP